MTYTSCNNKHASASCLRRTHREKREYTQVLKLSKGSRVAATHHINHFLHTNRVSKRMCHMSRDAFTWLSLNAAFSKQMAPGELPRKNPKSMWTT